MCKVFFFKKNCTIAKVKGKESAVSDCIRYSLNNMTTPTTIINVKDDDDDDDIDDDGVDWNDDNNIEQSK